MLNSLQHVLMDFAEGAVHEQQWARLQQKALNCNYQQVEAKGNQFSTNLFGL